MLNEYKYGREFEFLNQENKRWVLRSKEFDFD